MRRADCVYYCAFRQNNLDEVKMNLPLEWYVNIVPGLVIIGCISIFIVPFIEAEKKKRILNELIKGRADSIVLFLIVSIFAYIAGSLLNEFIIKIIRPLFVCLNLAHPIGP